MEGSGVGEAEWASGAQGGPANWTGSWEGSLDSALPMNPARGARVTQEEQAGVGAGPQQRGQLGGVASQGGGGSASSSEWLEGREKEQRLQRGSTELAASSVFVS